MRERGRRAQQIEDAINKPRADCNATSLKTESLADDSRQQNVLQRRERLHATTASSPQQFPDLNCFSHLRWDFVFQRPQHLLSRCARERRVFFVEEPIIDRSAPKLEITRRDNN